MSNKTAERENMCDDCQDLVGGHRHTPPHANLVLTGSQRCSSMMGAADEAHYKCKKCGHEWMHETGTCGYGWLV